MKKKVWLGVCVLFFCILSAQRISAQEIKEGEAVNMPEQSNPVVPPDSESEKSRTEDKTAQTEQLPILMEFSDTPGSYAVYADTRAGSTTYLGISVYEKDSLLVRAFNPEDKTFSLFFCALELLEKDGKTDITGIAYDALGAPDSGEAALQALESVCLIAEHWQKNRNALEDNIQATFEENAVWRYEYWIPVFQLRSATKGNAGLELITAGIMESLVDERFVSFEGLPETVDGSPYTITPAEKQFPVIDGMQVPLDENWATRDNRFFFIQSEEKPDALFFVQTFDFSVFGTNSMKEIARQQLQNLKTVLLAQETRVFELPDGTVNVFLRSYDPLAKQAVIEQYQYIKRNETRFSIATLSCFETMYLANKDYFDKIIY